MKKAEIIISEFSNPTREGITLHLNSPARLKTGTGAFKEHWVSWDKIGKLLFNNYTDKIEVSERDKLRLKLQHQEVSEEEIENEAEKIFNIQDPQQFLGFMKGAKWMQSKLKGNG